MFLVLNGTISWLDHAVDQQRHLVIKCRNTNSGSTQNILKTLTNSASVYPYESGQF